MINMICINGLAPLKAKEHIGKYLIHNPKPILCESANCPEGDNKLEWDKLNGNCYFRVCDESGKMSELENYNIVGWWENELTGKERSSLRGDYHWHGSTEERRKKLREMRSNWARETAEKLN